MPLPDIMQGLTFDDVLLVPRHSTVLPKDVTLASQLTQTIPLNIPLLAAAMDTVSEARLAIALAQEGGMAFIHKNMSQQKQILEVRKVKKFESGVVKEPIIVRPDMTVAEIIKLSEQLNYSGFPVVEKDQVVGIVTSRDIRFATNLESPISEVMTPKQRLVTVKEGASREQVIALLHKHRIEKILIVDDDNRLSGMMTVKDILKSKENPYACKDNLEQLRVGAAVGVAEGARERIEALVDAGVDALVVDTAHGHSQAVIEQVAWVKQQYPSLAVIGGNIATKHAALALADAGADAVKVGIGPGSICTTRIIAGVGVPQFSAVLEVAQALQDTPVKVIADGGIRFSGDICKALAAGADSVMIGSLFAGTEESPGEIELYQGRTYKSYRGMGSLGAMAQHEGSSDRYFQEMERVPDKLVPEGIEARVPYKGPIANMVHQLMGGLRSSMGYTGSHNLAELRDEVNFVKITAAGMRESHVHDVSITKQAPNYQIEE